MSGTRAQSACLDLQAKQSVIRIELRSKKEAKVSLEGVTYRAIDLSPDHDDQAWRRCADDVTDI